MLRQAILLALVLITCRGAADPAAWQVSGEHGAELWLLGSVHYLRADDHPLPSIVAELYEQADGLIMELDLDDIDPIAMQAEFLGAAMLPPGQTLQQAVGDSIYREAAAASREFGVDLSLMAQFEPWLVAITLMDLGMARLGFKPEHGLEQHLLRRAASDGKPVLGLEALATQIRVFDTLTDAEQRDLLSQTLAELDTSSTAMAELVTAWREGRLDTLATGLMQEFQAFPRLYRTLVVERNRNWTDALEEYLAGDARHLVIVGALHLVGENSVIDLLEARGFDVIAVN